MASTALTKVKPFEKPKKKPVIVPVSTNASQTMEEREFYESKVYDTDSWVHHNSHSINWSYRQ